MPVSQMERTDRELKKATRMNSLLYTGIFDFTPSV